MIIYFDNAIFEDCPKNLLLFAATEPTSSTEQNPGGRVSPGMVVGTFNISEQGDGAFPDLNRVKI